MLLENYGVHMIGSIVDIDGQASLYFSVGDDYKEFRDRHKMVLGQQMKDMEHEFGCAFLYFFWSRSFDADFV
jgi:hypothetical protein